MELWTYGAVVLFVALLCSLAAGAVQPNAVAAMARRRHLAFVLPSTVALPCNCTAPASPEKRETRAAAADHESDPTSSYCAHVVFEPCDVSGLVPLVAE
ncbi:hypothetical protein ACP70R_019626 [Stipagrostis hirtigluma subsp. patula]